MPYFGGVRKAPGNRGQEAAAGAASRGIRRRGLFVDDERDVNFGLPVAGSTPDGGPPRWGSDIIRDGETPVAADRGGDRPGPGAGFAGVRERHPSYRTSEEMDRIGGGSSPTAGYLDPQSEAWLRDLLQPIDTASQEDLARQQSESALARSRADLAARGGMGGMGLLGGNIAMDADLTRMSAAELADQILGIQRDAREEELRRGAVAAGMLDRGMERALDDEWMQAILEALGIGADDDDEDSGGVQVGGWSSDGPGDTPSGAFVVGDDSWVGDMLDKDPGQMTALPGHPDNPRKVGSPDKIPQPATQTSDGLWIGADGDYYRVTSHDVGARPGKDRGG